MKKTLSTGDQEHLAAVAHRLAETVEELTGQLAAERRRQAGLGQNALERDQQVHRLSARLRTLERYREDLCLGRMVLADRPAEPVYIGRLGLTDTDGTRLLVDWRSPAAEPFFGATHQDPMGLVSRRRYRWSRGEVSDYWDEVFTADGVEQGLAEQSALDAHSAFIASLGDARSGRMRDVLGTIQADQDAIIRAGSRGALVVDGGPGTGKTVVALHRAAYLLYADPRLGHHRGGVLFVGPHEPYLAYVEDVLPSLGQEGVQTCTLLDLVADLLPASADGPLPVPDETDPQVARLKATADMVQAIEPAVALYEEPPTEELVIDTPAAEVTISQQDWAQAFESRSTTTPHNEAREEVLVELVEIVVERVAEDGLDDGFDGDGHDDGHDPDIDLEELRTWLLRSRALRHTLEQSWPLIGATDLVGDLWTVPAYLRRCAPWLTPEEVRALQRADAQAWTTADLPLLDAARHRLGDPGQAARQRRHAAAVAAERERMASVVDDLIAHDDSEMQVMSMLRKDDLADALVDEAVAEVGAADVLAGPFLHVVVDEAQELTDAQWQMVLRRCPSRSLTVVGDRAQARHGFAETWAERLARVGVDRLDQRTLTINYRTPAEVMEAAEPVIRAVLPDANVPTSVRSTGMPVRRGPVSALGRVLEEWLAAHDDGIAAVISADGAARKIGADRGPGGKNDNARVRYLTPELAKGLEFDLVVLVDPERWGGDDDVEKAVDRYVAMTRATRELVILSTG